MKKRFTRKKLAWVLIFILTFASFNVFGSNSYDYSQNIDNLNLGFEYRIIDKADIPDGILPMEFTEEEYKEFLIFLSSLYNISNLDNNVHTAISPFGPFPLPIAPTIQRLSQSQTFWTITGQATIEYFVYFDARSGLPTTIRNHGWNLTGWTSSVSLSNTTSFANIINNSVRANGTANLNFYTFVSGIFRIHTQAARAYIGW